MNITQIELNIKALIANLNKDTFIYDLLLAYGVPKSSIVKLQKGSLNLSKNTNEILWKKKLFFKVVATNELYTILDSYKQQLDIIRHNPRFIIVTDYQELLAIDTKTLEPLATQIIDFANHLDFFLPWADMEKATYQGENPADVKAAEKMAKLFDVIRYDNPHLVSDEEQHSLNVFLSRLLFCFFAENTEIFTKKLFTNSISNYTQADGSDLHEYLDKIFAAMNHSDRDGIPDYIARFPYVNGGLFKDSHPAPKFSSKSRQLLLDSGDLDWSVINPDIFGSMMQAVVDTKQRSSLGMHYTSVPNIMKVVEPLFLNELKEELDRAENSKAKLDQLLERISKIKLFDPACGSGNFLIIAYKELRDLEIKILHRLIALDTSPPRMFSRIYLNNFYGIEIDDFAHEIAKLSLWIAEHQKNMKFASELGALVPALPLRESGNIVCANACRVDWEDVCPKASEDEIYVLGNPPYLGAKNQNDEQKYDMSMVFKKNYKTLDYVSAWFILGKKYIENSNVKYAFVATNSICQGEQVANLWSQILKDDIEIFFAHQSFKWVNSAKSNAGVTVIIVGVCNKDFISKKQIYNNETKSEVSNINAYLSNGNNILIHKLNSSISSLPLMPKGNMPYDGGNLILSLIEYEQLISHYPEATKFLKKIIDAKSLIDGSYRYCLWIKDNCLGDAIKIPEVRNRIELVKKMRLSSSDSGAHKLANRSHQFREVNETKMHSLVIPLTTSERREYIPIIFIGNDVIPTNANSVIYDAETWIFGVISSKMHMAWVRAVSGRLETRIRYSSTLCYNTFPFPDINAEQKKRIEMYVFGVLDEREKHSEKTLAELYDPDKMPNGLREAHHNLDNAIEQCYRAKPFTSDEERLEHLFSLYEQMTARWINK